MKGVTLMKKLISFFLALTILLAAFCAFAEEPAANTAIRYEGAGFDTPEDAVACYMNGLKNLDFEQMLSAYAWETLASHYSVEKFLQRIKAYIPTSYVRMPAANDFMVSATLHSLRAAEVRMIYNALEAYISFIRKKLKVLESSVTIKSVRNMGYKMEMSDERTE